MKRNITDRLAKSLKPEAGKRVEIIDTNISGLRLRANRDGSKTWSLLATDPNTQKGEQKKFRITLGEYPGLSLAMAREKAGDMKLQIRNGYNPVQAKEDAIASAQAADDAVTVKMALELYDSAKLSSLRTGYAINRDLKRDFASLMQHKAHKITSKQIADVIDNKAKKSPVMARRLHAYGRAWFKWLKARQHITENPFDPLEAPGSEKARERVLLKEEVGAIWNACPDIGAPFSHCIRVLLLTGQRREEVAGMKRDELDIENQTWTVPADRSKTGRALKVPLPSAAVEEIEAAMDKAAGKTLVFSTTGRTPISGFSRAKLRLDMATQKLIDIAVLEADREVEPVPGWRLHDFRRTMVSTMADMGVDPTVADRCLNHKASATMSTVQRVYQQSDLFKQREHATNAWAAKVMEWAGIETASTSSDVIPLVRDVS